MVTAPQCVWCNQSLDLGHGFEKSSLECKSQRMSMSLIHGRSRLSYLTELLSNHGLIADNL